MSSRSLTEVPGGIESGTTRSTEIDPLDVLALLDDEHARGILEATASRARPARELADQLDISRPTVYRRLERLEDAGLVEVSMAFDADGHHRKTFRATLDTVTVDLYAETVNSAVQVVTDDSRKGVVAD